MLDHENVEPPVPKDYEAVVGEFSWGDFDGRKAALMEMWISRAGEIAKAIDAFSSDEELRQAWAKSESPLGQQLILAGKDVGAPPWKLWVTRGPGIQSDDTLYHIKSSMVAAPNRERPWEWRKSDSRRWIIDNAPVIGDIFPIIEERLSKANILIPRTPKPISVAGAAIRAMAR